MERILICDDERDIVRAIKIYLTDEGYEVLTAESGYQALEILKNEKIHLILLDIMMPGMDGYATLMKIREKTNVPVIFLTAKSENMDKVLGLTVGADDYITKPFSPNELKARVRSNLRRYLQLGGSEKEVEEVIRIGDIVLDDRTKNVTLAGSAVALTPKEFDILKLLMQHPGEVFSSERIYQTVWQNVPFESDNTVAVHIRHLREKIEEDPSSPRYLKVAWGQGYRMDEETERS